MLVTHGNTRNMSSVSLPAIRDELAATLEETLRQIEMSNGRG